MVYSSKKNVKAMNDRFGLNVCFRIELLYRLKGVGLWNGMNDLAMCAVGREVGREVGRYLYKVISHASSYVIRFRCLIDRC